MCNWKIGHELIYRASDKCQKEKRKTINGDDLLWAMATLGFEDYIDPLKIYLSRYREVIISKLFHSFFYIIVPPLVANKGKKKELLFWILNFLTLSSKVNEKGYYTICWRQSSITSQMGLPLVYN